MAKRLFMTIGIFLLVVLALGFAGRAVAQGLFSASSAAAGETIALIKVEGVITGGSAPGGMFAYETGASSLTISDLLHRAKADSAVKAVVLRVNSPGGSAAASDEIYQAILECSKTKPVVVSMGDVAASGGYYLASAADYIFANGATLTGSIGVIFSLFNWQELAAKIGIEDMTLTAGEHKDLGSPWRGMTTEEQAVMKDLLDEVHGQFIRAVAAGRANLSEEQVRELATGDIFTGESAVGNGLVDEVGGLYAALAKAQQLAGVGPDVELEEYGHTKSFLEELLMLKQSANPFSAIGRVVSRDPLEQLSRNLFLSTALARLEMR